MPRKPRADRWVDKLTALSTLASMKGPCTAGDFAVELKRRGFRMEGDHRAWKILDRLQFQGLVGRELRRIPERYELPCRDGETRLIRRSKPRPLWAITRRGRKKLKYLAKAIS